MAKKIAKSSKVTREVTTGKSGEQSDAATKNAAKRRRKKVGEVPVELAGALAVESRRQSFATLCIVADQPVFDDPDPTKMPVIEVEPKPGSETFNEFRLAPQSAPKRINSTTIAIKLKRIREANNLTHGFPFGDTLLLNVSVTYSSGDPFLQTASISATVFDPY